LNEDVENIADADNTAASSWLQDLGIDQTRYKSLNPTKIREYLLM